MAVYLPIRALNRSSRIRIGGQLVTPTTTAYVDISDGKVRKELASHAAIGQFFAVGPLTNSKNNTVVVSGGVVTVGSGTRTVDISAGTFKNRSTGVVTDVALVDELAGTANASGSTRVDTVVWTSGGAGAIRTPGNVLASDTPLYTVSLANGGSAYTSPVDVRPRD